jgi:ubiquinone biosynthesis O-methyltransferase
MIEERVTPGKSSSDVMQEHLDRYHFAQKYTFKRRVLDVACGTGYGSQMLSKNAESVTGVDISQETIDYARANYPADNLYYFQCDALKLPFYDDSFDVVVSFETIEHISNYETFLRECRRVLKPDGIFICSTPNALISSPLGEIVNPYHVIEFSYDEFTNILHDHFSIITTHGQHDIDLLKNWIFDKYLTIKKALGIKRDIFYRKESTNFCQEDPSMFYPVRNFKNGLVKSAYMIAVCKGDVGVES